MSLIAVYAEDKSVPKIDQLFKDLQNQGVKRMNVSRVFEEKSVIYGDISAVVDIEQIRQLGNVSHVDTNPKPIHQ